MFQPKLALAMALILIICAAAFMYREKDPHVQLWLDAAEEEGLHLRIVRDSALLDPMFQMRSSGLILPDQVHRQANDALIGAIHRYVEQGGNLMLVYDACTWDLHDRYPGETSRLSDLAGVDYALYDRFGTDSITSGSIWGTTAAMKLLAISPGSYSPAKTRPETTPLHKVALRSSDSNAE